MRLGGILLMMTMLASCAGWGPLTQKDLLPESTMERVKAEKEVFEARKAVEYVEGQKEIFGVLAEFVGHTYVGEPRGGDKDALADFQEWSWHDERVPTLQIRHSLEDGSYGGSTIVRRNEVTGDLSYVYTTTAGLVSKGVFNVSQSGKWSAEEKVEGHESITKVRSKGNRRKDGSLVTTSEYFQDGRWVAGDAFVYRRSEETLEELLAGPKRFGWIPGR